MDVVSSFTSIFAILAPSKAACSSNLATDIVFLGATLVLAIIIFLERCSSFLTVRRYATAAQKTCISNSTSSLISGLIHLGIFSSLSSSSFSSHLIHHLCSCSSIVSSQFAWAIVSFCNPILPFMVAGEANPRRS